MIMVVKVKRLSEKARLPERSTAGSAGADLRALLDEPLTIGPGQTAMLPTGLAFEIPEGYVGLVFARSSLGTKRGLAPANKVGVIDSDYRGEVRVVLHNHSAQPQTVEPDERVAQLAIVPFLAAEYEEAQELSDTQRGEGGFGSTGRS